MSALGPFFHCSTSFTGRPGCGRYFASGDRKSAVDVPEGADVEVYTIGCWQCENCSPRAPECCRKPIERLTTVAYGVVVTPCCLLPAGHDGECCERNPQLDYPTAYEALTCR